MDGWGMCVCEIKGGVWYGGLNVIIISVVECICFMISTVSLTLAVIFGFSPALLKTLTDRKGSKEIEIDKLQTRARHLSRSKNFLIGGAIIESFCSIVRSSIPHAPLPSYSYFSSLN